MEDERTVELETLKSIYPEMIINGFEGSLDITVIPLEPVSVTFMSDNGSNNKSAGENNANDNGKDSIRALDHISESRSSEIFTVSHLPPLKLKFRLPQDYPSKSPPELDLTSSWLDDHSLARLKEKASNVWNECQDMAMYDIIDILSQDSEIVFGLKGNIVIPASSRHLKNEILSYDGLASQQEFDNQLFDCAICQYSRKGLVCVQLSNCGHVFCTECLRSYYTACIEQGYILQVKCPQPDCGASDNISCELTSSDLLSLVGPKLSERYSTLKKKKRLESDPNTMCCPRAFCQALILRNPDDNLTICPECQFAFCAVCKRSWHGYFEDCRHLEPPEQVIKAYIQGDFFQRREIDTKWGKNNMRRWVENYQADLSFAEYMESNKNRACPGCKSPVEKSMGCNKITCSICHIFFCFLCGKTLSFTDPYKHYSMPDSGCYRKLFEGTDIEQAVLDPVVEWLGENLL